MADIQLLALDLMDTVVKDPFFTEVPRLLRRPMSEVFDILDPQTWLAFETGAIDEPTYLRSLYRTPRAAGLPPGETVRDAIVTAYRYMDGMEALLRRLRAAPPRVWALTNYSPWLDRLRAALALDRYFDGYVVSFRTGYRKPDPRAYRALVHTTGTPAGRCLFVDDRPRNVEAARREGMEAVLFAGAEALERDLRARQLL